MILDGVEENLRLDYKRADALLKTDGKKSELTKDVSAFANSSGGILIYGIAEFGDEAKRHLPEKLDPLNRAEISKEWLDQVIQTIQPRIEGVAICPVTIDEAAGTVCYVVEVPQSQTAHMARDHRYYKRQNFSSIAMEDYEVRDVMSRRSRPEIRASVYVNLTSGYPLPEGTILVKLENIGKVSIHHAMVELEIPVDLNGLIAVKDALLETGDGGDYYRFRLVLSLLQRPIFPGSYVVLREKVNTHAQIRLRGDRPVRSTRHMRITIFADEINPIEEIMAPESVLFGWKVVGANG